jgi:diguanylate cyclase (GGDEF)-like protein
LVFATALVASLAVVWLSAQSIQSFLREKLDQKFPAILERSGEQLDAWYTQRELDVQTFASSTTIEDNLGRLVSGREDLRARTEIEKYLAYVLDRFPAYESLFLLDEKGERMLGVGEQIDFNRSFQVMNSAGVAESLKAELGAVLKLGIRDCSSVEGRRFQIVSVPIMNSAGDRLASLHASIDASTALLELGEYELYKGGALFVIGSKGEVLMQAPAGVSLGGDARMIPMRGEEGAVEVYETAGGEEVIGSAAQFERFGWTIAVEEPYGQVSGPIAAIIRKILLVDIAIAVICCLIAAQLARSIVRPVQGLSDSARQVAGGELDVTFPASGNDEIGLLAGAFNEMMDRLRANSVELEENREAIEDANVRLMAQNQELQRVNEVFLQLSITDDLTKLHNHRFFQDHLPREMIRAQRTGEPLCMILIDIDDFKKLNDQYGHSVGDAVLKHTADAMNSEVREMDLLARYGGEEFALLASGTTLEGAVALAEKLRMVIARARFPVVTLEGSSVISLTVSVGVAQFHGDEKAFFNDADRALYRAKDAGKDCVMVDGEEGPPALG